MGTDFTLLTQGMEDGHEIELGLSEMSNRFTFWLTRVDGEDEPILQSYPETQPISTEELIALAARLLEIAGEWVGEPSEAQAELRKHLQRRGLAWVAGARP